MSTKLTRVTESVRAQIGWGQQRRAAAARRAGSGVGGFATLLAFEGCRHRGQICQDSGGRVIVGGDAVGRTQAAATLDDGS